MMETKDMVFDVNSLRSDFPILNTEIHGRPLVYFDNGATTQKPLQVIELIDNILREKNSSIHRGVHYLSDKATSAYENARKIVKSYINANSSSEIIFTNGATSSINLVAFSFGEKYIAEGDEILITEMEHHANIVPWQMLCDRKNASLKVVPMLDSGEINLEIYKNLFSPKTKIAAITQVSNSLGTINPIKEMINIAHEQNIPVLVDGAQAVQHLKVDVKKLDCDFYVFSGHKVYGPTGIGVLYGKEKYLEAIPPYQGGGDMVRSVTFEKTTYNELPFKFEAGTTNYVGAVGMGKALEYVSSLGLENISRWEEQLRVYAEEQLGKIDSLTIYGNAREKIATFSMLLDGIHQLDTGMVLDKMGIAVRTGTHCTQPVMNHYNIEGTVRASMAMYNTTEEIDKLAEALRKVNQMFG